MKLISMTAFVLQFDKPIGYYEDQSDFLNCQVEYMGHLIRYAQFLKQPLTIGMFVPCDEDGNVLKEPTFDCYMQPKEMERQYEPYYQAKQKVLFEGFEEKGGLSVAKAICQTYQIIEDLTYKKIPLVDLILTKSAIKQIGL